MHTPQFDTGGLATTKFSMDFLQFLNMEIWRVVLFQLGYSKCELQNSCTLRTVHMKTSCGVFQWYMYLFAFRYADYSKKIWCYANFSGLMSTKMNTTILFLRHCSNKMTWVPVQKTIQFWNKMSRISITGWWNLIYDSSKRQKPEISCQI